MFEKFESWSFVAPAPPEGFSSAWNFWSQRGYRMISTGPSSFQGRSYQSRLGLYRVVDIQVTPSGSGCLVQMRYRADISEAGAVGGVVLAVVLLPVAVVGGAISWHQYEQDFQTERFAFWNFLTSQAAARPASGTAVPVPPPPEAAPPAGVTAPPPSTPPTAATAAPSAPLPSSPCPSCGKPLAGEGKFCASCGARTG